MEDKKAKHSETVSILLLMLTALIWGTAFVAQSVGMKYIKPFTFNFARFLIGGLVLLPVVSFTGKSRTAKGPARTETDRRSIKAGIICGVLLFAASSFQQFGILFTSVGKAGFITALYIIIVPVLGLFMKRKVPRTVWTAAVIALIGMYLLCVNEGFTISEGDILVFFCALVFSFHIMTVDHFSAGTDGVLISCVQFFTAGACSLCFMIPFEHPSFSAVLSAWLPVLYAGVLSCGVAYTLQIIGQKHVRPAIASLVMSLESVFSALAGWAILKETMSPKEVCGCILVFAAILIAQKS